MRIIKYTATFLLAIGSFYCSAQQTPIYSQYLFNEFVINPAVAGTYDYYKANTDSRFQWVGLKDAPITNILSVYGPSKTLPMGWGAYIYSDNQGPTSKIGFYASYAYHVTLFRDVKLSFGLSGGLTRFQIDTRQLDFEVPEDFAKNVYNYWNPDAVAGIRLYSARFHLGFSFDQLLHSKFLLNRTDTIANSTIYNRLISHFTVIAGYNINISRSFDIEPSFLFRAYKGVILNSQGESVPQIEGSMKLLYQKMVWLGVSYRSSDAIVALVGYNYKDRIIFGYSYDYTLSRLNTVSNGTHELMIGVRFNKVKNTKALNSGTTQ